MPGHPLGPTEALSRGPGLRCRGCLGPFTLGLHPRRACLAEGTFKLPPCRSTRREGSISILSSPWPRSLRTQRRGGTAAVCGMREWTVAGVRCGWVSFTFEGVYNGK